MICLSSICSSMVSTANHTNMGMISSKKKMGVSPRKIILSFHFDFQASLFGQCSSKYCFSLLCSTTFGRCRLLKDCSRIASSLHGEVQRCSSGTSSIQRIILQCSPCEDAEEEKVSRSMMIFVLKGSKKFHLNNEYLAKGIRAFRPILCPVDTYIVVHREVKTCLGKKN